MPNTLCVHGAESDFMSVEGIVIFLNVASSTTYISMIREQLDRIKGDDVQQELFM